MSGERNCVLLRIRATKNASFPLFHVATHSMYNSTAPHTSFSWSSCTYSSTISMTSISVSPSTWTKNSPDWLRGICNYFFGLILPNGFIILAFHSDVRHRPLTHAPKISAIGRNSTPASGVSFSSRHTTSNVVDCLRVHKAVNDVRSRASAQKNGRRNLASEVMAPISRARFWSMCQRR